MDPKAKAVSGNAPKKKKQQSPAKKFIFTVMKLLIVFFIALACAVTGIVGGAIYGYVKTADPITQDILELKNLTTYIYDSKGNEIAPLKGLQNRVLLQHDQIPDDLRNAFVAIEDERFYKHHGIDIKRTLGAGVSYITHLGNANYGGSTITQQLVRNLTGATQRTLQRKIQEQYQAIELEKNLNKDQILDTYMNLIFMGGNLYGVESASKRYFNKSAKDLTLAQCASMAGITNNPSLYNPLTVDGRKNNKKRQETILDKMLELGYINQQQHDQAIKEDLQFSTGSESAPKTTTSQSYFVDQVIIDVRKDLIAKGWSEDMANIAIFNRGLKIYTTQDTDMQNVLNDVFTDEKFFPKIQGRNEHAQAAMVIVDPYTGQVKAMYGGYGPKKADMVLNRATQMKRQAGSSFKPIAVYGPAINERLITPGTIIDDAPVHMDTQNPGKAYPVNYESGSYKGLITLRDGLRNSQNVVAAKVWRDILGAKLSLEYLKKVGLNRDKEPYVSLALGGLNEGVNPLQMASAYTPFANKGLYSEPITYTKVLDKDGKVLLEKKSKSSIVYDEAASYIMTNMMQDVCRNGTATPFGLLQNGNMPTAGKTGTTSGFIDKWFVGFSPYYIGATWYGYDNKGGTPIQLQPAEYNGALNIWHEVMERVHKNLAPKPFPEAEGLVRKTICIYSGKVPGPYCAEDPRGDARRDEVFIKGTEPKDGDICDIHVKEKVCTESKDAWGRNLLAGPYCPLQTTVEKVFIQRKVPYSPQGPNDPYPDDWKYEAPAGEYCTVHGTPADVFEGIGTGTSPQSGTSTPPSSTTTTNTNTNTNTNANTNTEPQN